jgi:phosphoribosyl 1,2-cyclic phosphodiesterase
LRLVPLGSGSQGNATLVEFDGVRVLVDAGFSARGLERALRQIGVDPASVDAVLLTHEHQDHARGAERFSVKHGVPLICSHETLTALDRSPVDFAEWRMLPEDGRTRVGPVEIEAFAVPHDAVRPVGYVLMADGVRVGIATDLGHATSLVVERLRGCEVIMVEANHDPEMLIRGPYPWQLKQRVGGRMGHLSNRDAASLLARTVGSDCRAVVLAHLSCKNNRPELARQAAARAVAAAGGGRADVRVASPLQPTAPVVVP